MSYTPLEITLGVLGLLVLLYLPEIVNDLACLLRNKNSKD